MSHARALCGWHSRALPAILPSFVYRCCGCKAYPARCTNSRPLSALLSSILQGAVLLSCTCETVARGSTGRYRDFYVLGVPIAGQSHSGFIPLLQSVRILCRRRLLCEAPTRRQGPSPVPGPRRLQSRQPSRWPRQLADQLLLSALTFCLNALAPMCTHFTGCKRP